jgi:hypothetical protein
MKTNREYTRMDTNVDASNEDAMLVSGTVSIDHVKSTPVIHQRLSVFFPRL